MLIDLNGGIIQLYSLMVHHIILASRLKKSSRYLDSESSLGPTLLPLEFKSFIDEIGTKTCDLECTPTLVGGLS